MYNGKQAQKIGENIPNSAVFKNKNNNNNSNNRKSKNNQNMDN